MSGVGSPTVSLDCNTKVLFYFEITKLFFKFLVLSSKKICLLVIRNLQAYFCIYDRRHSTMDNTTNITLSNHHGNVFFVVLYFTTSTG